ncbi:uncharacterized protein containing a von Willebrand factor type A (vWA) domain [Beggiatoa alba B18LD]|uniref:Uncharacterized protein containing a von Willebrand factor type A (VWA) domain n=1 Tax=Beggiatoa alba B18LD TaxID=395493 RepID=I3CF22_9GAMM|nr:VWA domain-containing protein [Beggiatoa alba]EIJ42215.1 uncharacterized protein containing a von Willebrand factor type A (vWA) domain [Beggiatoa alba B18LD]
MFKPILLLSPLVLSLLIACQPNTSSPNGKTTSDYEAKPSLETSAGTANYVTRGQPQSVVAPSPEQRQLLENRENYAHLAENSLKLTKEQPISTFSIDVDTGSYSNIRRFLNQGSLPNPDAVRVEEMLNYFSYQYPYPNSTTPPFKVTTELAPAVWNPKTLVLSIGIQGYDVPRTQLPASNLVFLIDVSGSMNSPDKLGLLKTALQMLSSNLSAKDRVSIVVYAGASGVVLEPTAGNETATINAALQRLIAGGSTNGGEGIQLAYAMAQQAYIPNGINRILLATDGDFNVGLTDFEALKSLVSEKRKSGIALTTLGFGTGNYNDELMEQLADAGNGHYAYIDTLNEARKVLVDEISSTLQIIAKDVKIQVEFNPTQVTEYRLIGYENRILAREDFNNDKVDAGEIGAGHRVTALYEITLQGSGGERLEPLRYDEHKTQATSTKDEIAFLRLRYKAPNTDTSELLEYPILLSSLNKNLNNTSENFRFASAVAAFGQLLRGGKYTERFNYNDVINLAQQAKGADEFGYRSEFINLVKLAQSLTTQRPEKP